MEGFPQGPLSPNNGNSMKSHAPVRHQPNSSKEARQITEDQ